MMIATGCKSSKSTTATTYPIHIQQGDSANVLVSNFNQVITDYKVQTRIPHIETSLGLLTEGREEDTCSSVRAFRDESER